MDIFTQLLELSEENEKEVRLNGRLKDVPFKIKALTNKQYQELQKLCTKVDKKGKREFDTALFQLKVCIECCVDPDFHDADFMKQAGVASDTQLLNKVLRVGEIATLAEEILNYSGFGVGTVEDAEDFFED